MRKELLAGAGSTIIRFPEEYFPIEGFKGIHDDVSARVLVLEEKIRFVFVSLELPSLKPQGLIDQLREWIGCQAKCPAKQVWIAVTHNTSAPHVPHASLRDENEEKIEEKRKYHMDAVKEAIKESLQKALGAMRRARMGVGTGESDVNINRDILTARGWWVGRNPEGFSDKTLTVIKVEALDGEPLAVLFHYAVKSMVIDDAPMMDGWRYSSADFTGETCRILEQKLKAPVFFLMGASADQAPREMTYYYEADANGEPYKVNRMNRGFTLMEQLGQELGRDVETVLSSVRCNISNPNIRREEMKFTFDGQKIQTGNYPVSEWKWEKDGKRDVITELLCLDQLVLIGTKPEIMARTGTEIRKKSPFSYSLLLTMVNGNQNYMAEHSAFERYTFEALHSCVAAGAAEEYTFQLGEMLTRLYKERKR